MNLFSIAGLVLVGLWVAMGFGLYKDKAREYREAGDPGTIATLKAIVWCVIRPPLLVYDLVKAIFDKTVRRKR